MSRIRQLAAWRCEIRDLHQDVAKQMGVSGTHGFAIGAATGCYLGARVVASSFGSTDWHDAVVIALTACGSGIFMGAVAQAWRRHAVSDKAAASFARMAQIRDSLASRDEPTERERELMLAISETLTANAACRRRFF